MKLHVLTAAVFAMVTGPGYAQETRGMIHGRLMDPQASAVAGAQVTVRNTATNTTVRLSTNETGYYEASLLLPGEYTVEGEASGFKKSVRRGIVLSIGGRAEIDLQLELGSISESVSVTGEAPILDTSTASSGRVIERKALELPTPSGNAMQLVRLTPGVQSSGNLNYNTAHAFGTVDFFLPGKIGGPEYSVDGAPNNGNGRNPGYQPHVDTIQEVKVETGNFDAAIGHSSGVNVSMMTKAGTNRLHGTATWEHFQQRWSGTEFFPRQLYYNNIAKAEAQGNKALADQLREQPKQPGGLFNSFAATIGGPVVIPKVVNGRNKLFFFFGVDGYRKSAPPAGDKLPITLPTMANRTGDYSQLLRVDASRYQIYDPLTVRADPARATHYVRDNFPGNIIPKSRQINPTTAAYLKLLPTPNNESSNPNAEPSNNYLAVGMPFIWNYNALNNRVDYNYSEKHRFFGRWSWSDFKEDYYDWMYETYRGLEKAGLNRHNAGATVDWVYTRSAATMLDVAVGVTQFRDGYQNDVPLKFKASDVGLPAYIDQQAGALTILPDMYFTGYTPVGPNAQRTGYPVMTRYRMGTGKATLTHIRGNHSLTAGIDVRQHFRTGGGGGSTSGAFTFNNTFTRRNDDTFTPAGDLGHSWAAYQLGIPSGITIANNDTYVTSNPYYGWFVQDNWRVTRKLSLNVGLRLEYELGPKERFNRAISYFDPAATLPIAAAAQAAYAQSPIPELSAAQFSVKGGSLYAGSNGASGRIWGNELMWLPRISTAYQINSKTVLRAGYGMFFDTNNVLIYAPDQTGFSRPTSTTVSNDFGSTWLVGRPQAGVSALQDPFPVRSDGTRFDVATRDALGVMARAGRGWSFRDQDFLHARVNRWRAGVQRQLTANTVLEAAYSGTWGDHISISQNLSPLPQQYWATGTVRNDAIANNLNANVRNPFLLSNFADLRKTNPLVYQDMSTQGFFTSSTIRKQSLLRAFPQMNGLTNQNSSVGKSKSHDLELSLQRRFSKGLQLNAGYTRLWVKDADYFYNEFDTDPSWRPSNNGRPHRIVASGIYELPFGKGKPLAGKGVPSAVLGGFQISLTWDYQPGPLIDFGNLYYYGDLANINTGTRTLDRWFNTDGFERSSAKGPAAYQTRVFPNRIDGLRGDCVNIWNADVHRNFRIREGMALQIRADALNLFNRSNFANPVTDPFSTNFGRVIATTGNITKRYIQLHARLSF
jgi:hypothetical protein